MVPIVIIIVMTQFVPQAMATQATIAITEPIMIILSSPTKTTTQSQAVNLVFNVTFVTSVNQLMNTCLTFIYFEYIIVLPTKRAITYILNPTTPQIPQRLNHKIWLTITGYTHA